MSYTVNAPGTITGASLPAMSTTDKGAVPATGTPSGKFLKDDGTWATIAGGGDLLSSNNLSDVANAATARNNILPARTGNALEVLRVTADETGYELAPVTAQADYTAFVYEGGFV